MPSKLRTPSPVVIKPVKPDSMAADIYRLDPDGDVALLLTRFVTYTDDEDEIPSIKLASAVHTRQEDHFEEGSVEIPLPDDDPDALLILLNIIHGHVRKVPLIVDLVTLTQLAILVDKYDIHEAVELFSNFWFENLKSTIPEKYTDDIPAWICISWVFNRSIEFKKTTRLALRQGRHSIPSADLPIPSSVVQTINTRRQEALGELLKTLYGHLDDYMENEHCSFECDALMLGSLTKRLRALKIFPHRPEAPYAGLCFEEFDYRFRQGMYFPGAQRTSTYFSQHSKCAIRSLDTTLRKCEEKLEGLEMNDYK
ncbi:hypothetical protein PRK78_004182 [Emydomyces testavorans]|uniref:BTB domain-containing protein n=1 Tax=Emydomyces testavorans TaxID=2070801 RepID=A0AAF0DIB0_9EURO|nr:hypothetical protein PRK78_004182 [Emydomyces testavorans]